MKNIYKKPKPKLYSGMYSNGDANLLQYIFYQILRKQQKYITQLWVSQDRIYMRRNLSLKKKSTDIDFVVTS